MARQIAPITVCIPHDRGISVGVSDCHQNTSASNDPLSVGVPSAPRLSVATGLSEFCMRASRCPCPSRLFPLPCIENSLRHDLRLGRSLEMVQHSFLSKERHTQPLF